MTQFLVTVPNWPPANAPFWLRGTIWTSHKDRATVYASREEAQQALAKACRFNPKAAKMAVIVEE